MKLVTTRFKSGGLHEKHLVATWNLGNISAFAAGNQTKIPLLSGPKPLYYIEYKQHISWWESNPGRLCRG